jgi:hypothetical protein
MDKQEIAHVLEKEIATIDRNLKRLQYLYSQTIDTHQARVIDDAIQDLVAHKQNLQKIIVNIAEAAKGYNSPFKFDL